MNHERDLSPGPDDDLLQNDAHLRTQNREKDTADPADTAPAHPPSVSDSNLNKPPSVVLSEATHQTDNDLNSRSRHRHTLENHDSVPPVQDEASLGVPLASPLDGTSPSDEVSLTIDAASPPSTKTKRPEAEVDREPHSPDLHHSGADERRVAFVPPFREPPEYTPPRSSYPVGPPPIGSAYGTEPMGQIGVHHPREIVRIERDFSGGELVQFFSVYPLELEGRITPTQWLDTVNGINEILISAHSLKWAAVHHVLAVLTLYLSSMVFDSHYDKEMSRLQHFIEQCNLQLYNSQGLNILWPRTSGFLFLEIEYY